MEIIDTYQLMFQSSIKTLESTSIENNVSLSDQDPIFDDPDSAYDYWVNLDIFEDVDKFKKEDLIKGMIEANKVQLDLQKHTSTSYKSNLMKQHSIQITLFDALVLLDVLQGNITSWDLKMKQASNQRSSFEFCSDSSIFNILNKKNKISLKKNNQDIGSLSIDFEQQVIEKIYGKVDGRPFIIDPIWKYRQTTIDAVKLILGDYKTEVVHHPKHKQTLWRGKKKSEIMAITFNKTYHINQNLYLNKKHLVWPDISIQSLQWFAPWQHFPILGEWFVYE